MTFFARKKRVMLQADIEKAEKKSQSKSDGSTRAASDERVIEQLSEILNNYLKTHPNMTLNGLSKKCRVSEPTIRRIAKRQVKTLPTVSTVLDLLTVVSKINDLSELVKFYGGAVSDFIHQAYPHLESHSPEYSNTLNQELQNPVKYLIFKLSLNRSGVSEDKVKKLFGDLGIMELKSLIEKKVIIKKQDRYFSSVKNFSGSYEDFVEQFKWTSSFIKTGKVIPHGVLNPLFVNGSESISQEAYKEIVKIQKLALKKISQVIANPDSNGPVPVFFLCALDTLDTQAAHEMD